MSVTFREVLSSQPLRTFSIITFIICAVVLVADGMDAQLLGIVAPLIIDEYGIERGTFGIAMSSALIGFGLGSLGGGWLGDNPNVGRRWSLAIAATVFSLGTIAASTSGDVWQMAFWRLVSGLGFGAAYAVAITMLGEWLPDRWRSVGITTISVGTPAGGLVVSSMAPTLVESYGWRGSFVFLGILTFLVVIAIIVFLRDSPTFLLARGKVEEAKKAALKVSSAVHDLIPEGHDTDTEAGGTIGVFHRSNLRLNVGVGLAFTAATGVAYGVLNWTTTLLTGKGFEFDEASYAVAVAGMTSIFASIAAGLVIQQFGSKRVMATYSGSLAVVLIVLMFTVESLSAVPDDGERLTVVVLIGIAAALFSASIASMYAIMTHSYPPTCRAVGIGFGIFMARFGAIASSAFGGALLDIGDGSTVPFFGVLCIGALLISAAAFVIDRPIPPVSKQVTPTPETV